MDYNQTRFCKEEIAHSYYCKIVNRLNKLNDTNKELFTNLVQNNDKLYDQIELFYKTRRENWTYDNPLLSPIAESDTYQEIVMATVKEQEAWSERGNSPSIHSQGLQYPVNESVIQDNQSMLPPLLNELDKVGYFKDKDVNTEIAKSIKLENIQQPSRSNLFEAIKARRNDKDVIGSPHKVEVDSGSNSSMEHYFPES